MNTFSGKPTHLSSLLGNLVRKRGIAEESANQVLENIWKQCVTERVASKSHVKRFSNGVLEITVTNGAILEELTCYLKHEILPALQERHPEPPITSLKFVKVR